MLNIVIAELIEGNYVLYQGDLSTNDVGKAQNLRKANCASPCCIKSRLQLASLCTNSWGAG
ncbi:hypothetical protein [Pseudomonas sihuiensis]|uniref:hypothetical protein n=1 Tax=Pseudomonas sihuiensis TaxID=1274359 RepID=UPI0038B69FE9